MNGYTFTKGWFAFCASKRECSPIHTALYLWLVEQGNLYGWPSHFPLHSAQAMKTLHIHSAKTYRKVFNNLLQWGVIRIAEKASNQYTHTYIALVEFTQAEKNTGANITSATGFGGVKNAVIEVKNTQANENGGVIFTPYYNKTNIDIKHTIKRERENTRTREGENQIKNFPLKFQEEEEKKKSCAQKRKEELSGREKEFRAAVFSCNNVYPEEILQDFFDYWSEPNNENFMRFELESTWELSRRLKTWLKREKEMTKTKHYGRKNEKLSSEANGYAAENLDYNIPL